MSPLMDEDIKRWRAKRKSALVLEVIQGKTTVAEASRTYDLLRSEIETWSTMRKPGWKMRSEPNRWMCASSMSGS